MADLTKVIPEDSQTVSAIYEWWKANGDAEPKRGYLGGSAIGAECERRLWYSFRDCAEESFEGRMYRLFNRGHREEFTFVDELKGIGCEVYEVDPDTGKQFEIALFGGHFRGHCDGVALGIPEAPKTWHLLEMKTSNTKDFKKLKKDGVEKSKPVHYAQMQIYMSEMNLTRALYIVVCKETDELYSERIRYDSKVADRIKAKAERIVFATTPPCRISERADSWACKFCPAIELCHGTGDMAVPLPSLSCRQCCHATPEKDGSWSCASSNRYGTVCDKHLMLPGLVSFAEPTDSLKNDDGSHVIEFTSEDGTVWHHGSNPDAGQYSSHNLITMPKSLIELPRGKDIKEPDGVTHPDLETKWNLSHEWIERVWKGDASELQSAWSQKVDFPMSNPVFEQSTDQYEAADFGSACVIIYAGGKLAEIRIDKNQ